jgi:hypothetical protein
MKIVYLVQGALDDLIEIEKLIPDNQYLITLNYEKEPDDIQLRSDLHLFLPNSTWAQGRNLLLEEALNTKINFDYFVFIDADLKVIRGDFFQFEQLLELHNPKLGLPLSDNVKNSYRYRPKSCVQSQFSFDQIMQAYRSDVVAESVCIPYQTEFDSESWWYACEINSYLSILYCGDEILQFNNIEILNSRHDGPELNKIGESNYKAGVTPSGLNQCRTFIKTKYAKEKMLIGTLFHPPFLPKYIYSPTLKQLIQKDFETQNSISCGQLLKACLKTLQIAIFKTIFHEFHIEIKEIA